MKLKLWTLGKYWMAYGILTFILNMVNVIVGLNVLVSLVILVVFGFGCILAFASTIKVVDAKVNPKSLKVTTPISMSGNSEKLVDVVYLREKDVIRLQVSPDAPFWFFLQKASQTSGEVK